MSGFEPAPDYLVGEFGGRKRYVRVYDQDMATANKYGDKATHNLKAWHAYQTHKKYSGTFSWESTPATGEERPALPPGGRAVKPEES